jgi:predicted NUDIX family NTP pyrophosphohydrolase
LPRRSAGIVLYRRSVAEVEVLLVHPGGPFFAKKDLGVWSIPKGEYEAGDDPFACALREFEEETGTRLDGADAIELGRIVQRAGKEVTAWALEGDLDPETVRSNTFTMQWPPRSGRTAEFPEVDRAEWFEVDDAKARLVPAQAELVDRLVDRLADGT